MPKLFFGATLSLFCLVGICLFTGFQTITTSPEKVRIEEDTCKALSFKIEHEWLTEDGDYEAALSYLDAASKLYQKHQLWEKYIKTLVEIAVFSDYLDYNTKAKYAKKALTTAQTHLPNNHLLLADAYRQNGEVYTAFQQYDSSLYCYDKALPIFEKYQKSEEIAWTKILQAVNYYFMGEHQAGQQILEEKFWSSTNLSEEVYSSLYNLRGVFYQEAGDLSQVIANTKQSLSLALANPPEKIDSSFLASLHNNLGVAYDAKGDLRRAMEYFQKALVLFQTLPGHIRSQISSSQNIGLLLMSQKKSKEALPYFHKNLSLLKQHPEIPNAQERLYNHYIDLGQAYRETTQYDSSLYYLNKAFEIGEGECLPIVLYAMGRYYTQTDQLDLAIDHLKQSINCFHSKKRIGLKLNRIHHRLGDAYARQKDYFQALQSYQKALASIKSGFSDTLDLFINPTLDGIINDDIYFLESLHEKAKMLSHLSDNQKEIAASLSTYLLTIQWTDSLRQSYVLEDNELFWSKKFKNIYSEAIHTAYRLYEKTHAEKHLETALILSEKSKSILLLEAFITKTGSHKTSVSPEMLKKERDLSIDIAYYEKSYDSAVKEKDTTKINLYLNYLRDSRLALASLKEKIEHDHPDYFRLKYENRSLDILQIQESLLDYNTVLIEYFIGQEHAYAFMVTKDALQMTPLEHPDSINQRLLQFNPLLFDIRSFLNNPQQAFQKFNNTAHQLYSSLLAAPHKSLAPDINKLIIIPDEGLNTLPFEVINTKLIENASANFSKLPYLIKDYQIHYGYSIKLLQKNQERHQHLDPNIRCLAFAPPYKSDTAVAQFESRSSQVRNSITPLENTAAEIKAIKQHYNGHFVSTPDATKANFLAKAQNYGILHLAMHGEADFENTRFGHLIFSNADTNSLSHNLLYHYEIANLNLDAQLAVLSACETGVGKYESGEGVFSIARSFMYAGIPSIVMSLWKVNDQSTSQIMPLFYKKLAQGKSKNHALQKAKLEYLEYADLAFKHPYYWASFVSLGDPQPVRRPFAYSHFFGSICLAFLGIGVFILFKRKYSANFKKKSP